MDEDKVRVDPEKCLTTYYDAWDNDNDNDCDPIISIVDCIKRAAEAEARDATKLKKIVADIFALRNICNDQ